MKPLSAIRNSIILGAMVWRLTGVAGAKDAFEALVYQSGPSNSLNYRIHIPEDVVPGQKYPLVLFFHGSEERGSDNLKQLTHGATNILNYSTKYNSPAIIIVPQCPVGMKWVDGTRGAESHVMSKDPTVQMQLSIELLNQVVKELPVDPGRIYVTGISMGFLKTT